MSRDLPILIALYNTGLQAGPAVTIVSSSRGITLKVGRYATGKGRTLAEANDALHESIKDLRRRLEAAKR